MSNQLEQRIAQFTDWRTKLVASIDEFRAWQDTYGHADIEQTLRIYDMVEGMRNDRIRLAFFGESAEDKIGLINALLFSDVPGGLLPLGTGSEFLCATKIFQDPSESPSCGCCRSTRARNRKASPVCGAARSSGSPCGSTRIRPSRSPRRCTA